MNVRLDLVFETDQGAADVADFEVVVDDGIRIERRNAEKGRIFLHVEGKTRIGIRRCFSTAEIHLYRMGTRKCDQEIKIIRGAGDIHTVLPSGVPFHASQKQEIAYHEEKKLQDEDHTDDDAEAAHTVFGICKRCVS